LGVRRNARDPRGECVIHRPSKFLSNLYINKDQDQFENGLLAETGQTAVVQKFAQYGSTTLGITSDKFRASYQKDTTDTAARIEFKYSASRGANGTPIVSLNGVES
jgi:hypothetical protein